MYNIEEILDILPHRYPLLLVDKILELQEGEKVVGLKNVTYNENFFQGHYPEKPIMPGVLIVEALAQTGGFLMLTSSNKDTETLPYFAGIDKAKFRKPVQPGDQLKLVCEVIKLKGRVAKVKGEAYVGEDLVAEGRLLFAMK
ncbi:MAG TPA: 3-hydroxyacyl-ACP dehydratase FabZ [Halanaerobiales bacterium]|nr:3-hydroxyacyl-ACP dehydratase FabZ [Halanaerobiales bacterium]